MGKKRRVIADFGREGKIPIEKIKAVIEEMYTKKKKKKKE